MAIPVSNNNPILTKGGISPVGGTDWMTYYKMTQPMQETSMKTGNPLLAALAGGLAGFTQMGAIQQEAQKRKGLSEALASVNPLLAQNKYAEASSAIAPYDPELASKYAQQAGELEKWKQEQQLKTERATIMSPREMSSGKFWPKVGEETAKDIVKEQTALMTSEKKAEAANKNIESLKARVEKTPEITGAYSGTKSEVSRLTGGKFGFSPEQMKERSSLVQEVKSVGNQLMSAATEAGQSGINVKAEVDRILAGITPNSTKEEIQGALDAIKMQSKNLVDAQKAGVQSRYKVYEQFTGQKVPVLQNAEDPLGILE